MGLLKKLVSKLRASLYIFKKAEIMSNIVNKEIDGEYDNLCHQCYFNERYQEKARLTGVLEQENRLHIALRLGGALGDYIIYLRLVDELSSVCDCVTDLYLDRIGFAKYVFGGREAVTIVHDAENCLFYNSCKNYDLALHVDHGVTLHNCRLGSIREKAPDFYETACKIVEHCYSNRIDIKNQHQRESVILRRAQFLGISKWSQLSCGDAVDMSQMYSSLLLDANDLSVLKRYSLEEKRYITVNFGADKNMGGTAQTKVLPAQTLEAVIDAFKKAHPDYLIVQTGVKGSQPLCGVDRTAFACQLGETAVLLKNATLHLDSEGGLVHMAAQMSTPCVVGFGPTPVYYYGYPRNENVVAPACSNCMSVTSQWSRVCPRGMQIPACMRSITAEMLLEKVEKILSRPEAKQPKQICEKISVQPVEEQAAHLSRSVRVCFIGPLNETVTQVARKVQRGGHTVLVYLPTALDAEVIAHRTALRKAGIKVEYGNALNIPQIDSSFDVVFWDDETAAEPELYTFAQRELARILNNEGLVVRCPEQKSEL